MALNGIFEDGKLLLLAYDHGMEHGPSDFEEHPASADPETIFRLAGSEYVTGLAVQKGVAEKYYSDYSEDVNLVLKLNGVTSLREGKPYSALNCSVDYAEEIGADAVGYTIYPGSEREGEMFETFGMVQERARELGLPVLLWSYPRGGKVEDDTDPKIVKYAARLGLELGADVAKVKHPGSGEAAEEAVRAAGKTDLVLSGGAKSGDLEFLEDVGTVMDAGFKGIAVGRNVWQRENPREYLEAVGKVVFDGEKPKKALEEVGT
ncbi:MAG: aldolase [Candidatus Nanohaloarchaea archaeon]|nr:aldolase [Candidatus Nanohaloarchaea archaeon]